MDQMVETPNRNSADLDLDITNNAERKSEVKAPESLGTSDHKVITFEVKH